MACNCGQQMPASELEAHRLTDCAVVKRQCPNFCGVTLFPYQLTHHLVFECSKRERDCPDCRLTLWDEEMALHLEKLCTHRMVRSRGGCPHTVGWWNVCHSCIGVVLVEQQCARTGACVMQYLKLGACCCCGALCVGVGTLPAGVWRHGEGVRHADPPCVPVQVSPCALRERLRRVFARGGTRGACQVRLVVECVH